MCIADSGRDFRGRIRWYRDHIRFVRSWADIRQCRSHFGGDVYCKFSRYRADAPLQNSILGRAQFLLRKILRIAWDSMGYACCNDTMTDET